MAYGFAKYLLLLTSLNTTVKVQTDTRTLAMPTAAENYTTF